MATQRNTGASSTGAPDATSAEIRRQAQAHGPEALQALAAIMTGSGSEQARIAAAREILERAYGKTTAPPPDESSEPEEITIRYVNDWRGREESG